MSHGLSMSIAMTLFLLITSVVFLFLTGAWTNRSLDTALAINRYLARVESAIALGSTAQSAPEACDTFTVEVENTGEVSVDDFADADLLVEYTNTSDNKVATRLAYLDDWSVTGITPDIRDPNDLNPGETATISFTLSPAAKDATSGSVIVVTALGISDSIYFSCSIS